MNPDERAICTRLKSFREKIGWNRISFAAQLGITYNSLVGIELGHTPINYEVAWKIREVFGLSMAWLVDGSYPPNERDIGPWPDPKKLEKHRQLLSEIEKDLWAKIDPEKELKHYNKSKPDDIFNPSPSALAVSLKEDVVDWMARIPEDKAFEFYQDLFKFAEDYLDGLPIESEIKIAVRKRALTWDEMRDEINKRLLHRANKKNELTYLSNSTITGDVNQWHALKAKILKATDKPGEKSALAKMLGVDLTQLSRWLSNSKDAPEPRASHALKMLNWVEQQERQK
jgi:transcriptional regulator with XRE-family HTH domain